MTRRKNPLFAVGDQPEGSAEPPTVAEVGCPGCPVSMVMETFLAAQPEAMDHLLAAASETLAALQVVLDSAQDTIEAHRAALVARAAEAARAAETAATARREAAAAPPPPATPKAAERKSPRPTPTPHGRRSTPRVQHIDLG